ncbi:MAG: Hsp20/alpha crystallin family protein [Rhodospirillaceae bacterium]|jgi:HSP20 family protein
MAPQAGNIAANKSSGGATGNRPIPIGVGWDHPFQHLREEMNKVFDQFADVSASDQRRMPSLFDINPFSLYGPPNKSTAARPSTDVEETDKAYEISVELPGIDEKDVELSLRDDILTLKGEKKSEKEEKKKDYHVMERHFGSFQRSFRLPADVDDKKIDAEFSRGVLKITLPKSAKAQESHRKIGIKAK